MFRRCALVLAVAVIAASIPLTSAAGDGDRHGQPFLPGSPGAGDPYFPLDGNGGYDVSHYDLNVFYQPATDQLHGVAGIEARATQNLSQFDLDLKGLSVHAVRVNGKRADWRQEGNELVVTPVKGLASGRRFTTQVVYSGTPQPNNDPVLGNDGFIPTDDGALVIGEPHVASSWYPVNDHPSDKASYDFQITVPAGLQAVSNGELRGSSTRFGWTTWKWRAKEPMASYLTTATIGKFDLHSFRANGIKFVDAIDPDLLAPVATPTTGMNLLISGAADSSFKRLTRVISVPAAGAELSYWVTRDTEQGWDYTFVEAHTVGQDDWTTLPDGNGHTSDSVGNSCPLGRWQLIHPFLAHYQTDNRDGTCTSAGSTGTWSAATGASAGPELWQVDLTPFAGRDVEVSLSYASDEVVQRKGVFVDDIAVSTGEGNTSFEADANELDGWTVAGPPAESPGNDNDWFVGTAADVPAPVGAIVQASFARQPEILDFLSQTFGRYPFSAAGGIVDDVQGLGFALENQTRPIYSREFFTDQLSGENVIAHELTHQWFGDSLTVAKWQDIWLNEGFATYAEWLWSEHEGLGTAQEIADSLLDNVPADDPFWQLKIGDPGPAHIFDQPVYSRGGLTLHQLRLTIGDDYFFQLLRTWAKNHAGGNVSTAEFIALAEQISGHDLDEFFNTWLYTAGKPDVSAATSSAAGAGGSATASVAALAQRGIHAAGIHVAGIHAAGPPRR